MPRALPVALHLLVIELLFVEAALDVVVAVAAS